MLGELLVVPGNRQHRAPALWMLDAFSYGARFLGALMPVFGGPKFRRHGPALDGLRGQ